MSSWLNNTNGYCSCNNQNGVHVDSCCFSCDGTVPKVGPTGPTGQQDQRERQAQQEQQVT